MRWTPDRPDWLTSPRGLRLPRELRGASAGRASSLARFQQERLDALVRHAVEHSPFYRERSARAGRAGRAPDARQDDVMERFDDIVADPRLRRDELLAHVEGIDGDALYLGRYRAMTTSGSSAARACSSTTARVGGDRRMFLRYNALTGHPPAAAAPLRVAAVGGARGTHMSRRVAQTVDVGVHRVLALPVTLPLPSIVERAQPLPAAVHERLPVDRRPAGRGAARRPAADRARGHLDQQRAAARRR